MPRVSVVIPTHSRPNLLRRSVESALRAGRDVEVVVVDDASTDETASVCGLLEGIRYLRLESNQGVAGARNAGIRASTGEFISFLDDDDLRLPGSIECQLAALMALEGVGFVYGRVEAIDQDGARTGVVVPRECPSGDIFWKLLEWCFVPPQSVVMRRSCLEAVGPLESSVTRSDDWDLWIRLAEHFPAAFYDGVVALWRKPTIASGQGSSSWAEIVSILERVHERGLRLPRARSAPERAREARRRFRDNASDSLIWHAAEALEAGAGTRARDNLLRALRLNPTRALRPWTVQLLFRCLLPAGPGARS